MPNLVNPYLFNDLPFPSLLLSWYDAQDPAGNNIQPSNGTALSLWYDKAVNNYSASQGTVNRRPIFTSNVLNGRPGILFDGLNDCMFLSTEYTLPTTWTGFGYVQPTNATQGGGMIMATLSNVGGQFQLMRYQGDLGRISSWNSSLASANISTTTSPIIWTIRQKTSVTTGSSWRQNSVNLVSATTTTSTATFKFGSIGALDINASAPFQGYMFELLVYSTNLSDANCLIVENYLRKRWS